MTSDVGASAAGTLQAVLGQQMSKKRYGYWLTKNSLRNEKAKTKATGKFLFVIQITNIMNRPATLYEFLLVKVPASKDQIKKHYQKTTLLTHIEAGADREFFQTIN